MARRTKQEAEETRLNILNASLDIIYEKGYARCTFVDIATRINLTKGAVYWHFKNKPDLFISLGEYMEARINESLGELDRQDQSLIMLKEMLYESIRLIVSDQQLRKFYAVVFYRVEWTDDLLPVRDFFDRQEQELLGFVTAVMHKARLNGKLAGDTELRSLSRALLCLYDGLLGYCLARPGHMFEQLSRAVATGLDVFFDGLQCATEPASKADQQWPKLR